MLDQGKPAKELCEDDQHSVSSHEPSIYEISDTKEEKCDEDLVIAPHVSAEDYACHLCPKEAHCDDEVHLHEDKGLVSYLPFQISESNDETLDDLKRIDMVKKPLENEKFEGTSASPCDKQYGSQWDDDVGALFVIGRHRWDVDRRFLHRDSIYDTDSESMLEKNLNWHAPFPIRH